MTITLSPENAAAVAEFCGLIAWTPEQLANHLLAEALDLFADPRSGSLEGFLGAIDYPDRATAQRVLARVAQIVTIQFDGKLPESFQGQKAGGDRSDKSGGPGTNRWMKEQGKYRYLVSRPLCACGGKVSVHRFDPGSPLRFWGLDPRYLTCPLIPVGRHITPTSTQLLNWPYVCLRLALRPSLQAHQ